MPLRRRIDCLAPMPSLFAAVPLAPGLVGVSAAACCSPDASCDAESACETSEPVLRIFSRAATEASSPPLPAIILSGDVMICFHALVPMDRTELSCVLLLLLFSMDESSSSLSGNVDGCSCSRGGVRSMPCTVSTWKSCASPSYPSAAAAAPAPSPVGVFIVKDSLRLETPRRSGTRSREARSLLLRSLDFLSLPLFCLVGVLPSADDWARARPAASPSPSPSPSFWPSSPPRRSVPFSPRMLSLAERALVRSSRALREPS
mmetsp:Transcript_7106/g.21683  ORF Transcript_7106/g.21683 Transcript_7106/m.21683 type:complete len:261 (-) Transcript_7106:524-1306(-)